MISESYKALLTKMHQEQPKFGSKSFKRKEVVSKLKLVDILDYGCGKGNLGLECQKYDPGMPQFSGEPKPADLVVCTDVLEHIEPEMLDNVIEHLHSLTKKKAYLTIALNPSKEIMPDGRNAHLIVKPKEWWIEKLSLKFRVLSNKMLGNELEVVCEPL